MAEKKIQQNEASAIGSLRSLSVGQIQFQNSCVTDQDQDGTGEYGTLRELAGILPPRGKTEPVSPAFTNPSLGKSAHENNGIAEKSGYCFTCYLPGNETSWGEIEAMDNKADNATIDRQETKFIIYAWPAQPGKTGKRAFAVTQSGEIYYCDSHAYDRYTAPRPEDAFSASSPGAASLEGEMANEEMGHNGYWKVLD